MRRLVLCGALGFAIAGCGAVKDAFSGRIETVARAEGNVLEVDRLARQFGGHLAQMPRRASEPVQARHHEGVAFPHVFQACL